MGFRDISQQGACVQSDKWLLKNELMRLETGVTPALYAKVRWRSHPRYGLTFEHTFKLDELARISAPLQLADALLERPFAAAGSGSGEDRAKRIILREAGMSVSSCPAFALTIS